MYRLITAICLALIPATIAGAATIRVPSDVSTIQGAINAAADGDRILVAPGTYRESIDFNGKDVRVIGSDGADVTIIDGEGVRRGVLFQNGESSAAVMRGFTITNCVTTVNGGGMLIRKGSSPVILECVFSNNAAGKSGGAICVLQGSEPLIRFCEFTRNNAERFGGAIFVAGSHPVLVDSSFTSNGTIWVPGETVTEDGYFGGAVANWAGSKTTILRCGFSDNVASQGGGALYNRQSHPEVSECVFQNNRVVHEPTVTTLGLGGAMYNDDHSYPIVVSCRFTGNVASQSGGAMASTGRCAELLEDCTFTTNSSNAVDGHGGALYLEDGSTTVNWCEFQNNDAAYGGAIATLLKSTPALIGCMFTQNSATEVGGAIYNDLRSAPSIVGGEMTGNDADSGGGLASIGDSYAVISYVSICGNAPDNVVGNTRTFSWSSESNSTICD